MAASISAGLSRYLLVPIVVLWLFHLFQRRYREQGSAKRNATLYLTVTLLFVWALAYFLARFSLDDLYLVPIAFFTFVVLAWQRQAVFPFRLRCARCGLPLPVSRILFDDSNTCGTCELPRREGENHQ